MRARLEPLVPARDAPHAFSLAFCTRASLPPPSASQSLAHFDAAAFFATLATRELGAVLLVSERVTSTQSILAAHLHAVKEPLVFVASQQAAGRGRGGNAWVSPAGCLMFSFKWRTRDATQLAFLQYLVSLAVCDALGELPCLSHARAQQLRASVRIKWPNDLYTSDGQKIGGVLCQSSYMNETFDLLIGVGLNVSNAAPTTCLDSLLRALPGSGGDQCATTIPRELLLATLCNVLERHLLAFEQRGFAPFVDAYTGAWLHTNQQLRLLDDGGRERNVIVRGLTATGYLAADEVVAATATTTTAESAFAERFELHPDGNSLDFFAGLVARKRAT